MRTIDALLTYGFTFEEKAKLEILGVVNGCGAKWGFNFSDFVDRVQSFARFDDSRFDQLKSDMRELCSYQHDVRFYEGGDESDFWKANVEFTCDVLTLLHWTSFWRRAAVSVFLMLGLTLKWRSAFHFGTKRPIRELLSTP